MDEKNGGRLTSKWFDFELKVLSKSLAFINYFII